MKNGPRMWIAISPKKICHWPIDTWKAAWHHRHLGNENQTTMWHHFTCARMAIIKKKDSKVWRESGEIGDVMYYWWECENSAAIWISIRIHILIYLFTYLPVTFYFFITESKYFPGISSYPLNNHDVRLIFWISNIFSSSESMEDKFFPLKCIAQIVSYF